MNANWLRDILTKIEDKLDKLDSRIDCVDVTLAKQSSILEDHTRRSLANEEQVKLLKQKMEDDLKPIQDHINKVNLIIKIIGGSAIAIKVGNELVNMLSVLKIFGH